RGTTHFAVRPYFGPQKIKILTPVPPTAENKQVAIRGGGNAFKDKRDFQVPRQRNRRKAPTKGGVVEVGRFRMGLLSTVLLLLWVRSKRKNIREECIPPSWTFKSDRMETACRCVSCCA
ncbi:unnamed protein product, partial [Ectocarpus fasciculatus]